MMARVPNLTAAEAARIAALWPDLSINAIAGAMARDREWVRWAAGQLGLPPKLRRATWSAAEDAVVRARYRVDGAAALAAELGRSIVAVRQRWSDLVNGGRRKVSGAGRVCAQAIDTDALRPRVITARCPMCEARPGDPLCRHGWDGETTRAMRRDADGRLAAARVAIGVMA